MSPTEREGGILFLVFGADPVGVGVSVGIGVGVSVSVTFSLFARYLMNQWVDLTKFAWM